MATYKTAIVVHDSALRTELRNRSDVRHRVIAPCSSIVGEGFEAIVFLDRPTPQQCSSELWLECYRAWVDTALATRLLQGGQLFGLSEWAKL